MTTVSSRVFSANPIHYLNMASRESVAVKRGGTTWWITTAPPPPLPENISPSGDPFWADPRNVAELDRITNLSEEENPVVAVLRTSEDIKDFLDSL